MLAPRRRRRRARPRSRWRARPRLRQRQEEEIAGATPQAEAPQADEALAQASLFGENPDPAHDDEAIDYDEGNSCDEINDLWEYPPQGMSKE